MIEKIKKQLLAEIETLKHKRGFIKAGLPHFNRLFGRDSLIVSWQMLDIDSKICRSTLEILAELQGKESNKESEEEPGKILHEWKEKRPKYIPWPFPYYGSVDSTPLFLILFSFYFEKTKDEQFLKKYWENILAALKWMRDFGDIDKDGFLEYQRKNPEALFHQGWKDGKDNHLNIEPPVAIVETQGYQYLALRSVSEMAGFLGENDWAQELEIKAKNLKESFNKRFWMASSSSIGVSPSQAPEGYFCLGLDKNKYQRKAITSNPGHLLFTGIIDEDKVDFVVKRLFEKDMWTPLGIRTHSEKEPDFDSLSYHLGSVWPHDNWIIAQGLKKLGYKALYREIRKALLRAYQEIGFLPELYGVLKGGLTRIPRVCHPQAWASGALLNFLASA